MISKADRTKQFIIEKAAAIINRKGMAGTSINDIMEATKLAKGGVYGNFENKDEICAASFDYLMGRMNSSLDAKLAAKISAREKLFELLDYYGEISGKEGYYGCPMINFGAEADDTHPVIKQKVSKAIGAMENRISKIIKSGIEAGEFNKNFDASLFAVRAFAMIEGGIWIGGVQGNPKQLRLIIDMLKKEIETNCR